MLTLLDLHIAACIADADVQLDNRFQATVDGVHSTATVAKTIKGIMARTANTGYFKLIQDGAVIATVDFALINAMTDFIPLEIPCPPGRPCEVDAHSTTGTAVAYATLLVEEVGG